jgi:hypothetical protein
MDTYGFRSAAAFLRARDLPYHVFATVAADPAWKVAKRALLHIECPLDIRDAFRNDKVWYKRYTAIWASKAPAGYSRWADLDPDKRVRLCYLTSLHHMTVQLLQKLEVI